MHEMLFIQHLMEVFRWAMSVEIKDCLPVLQATDCEGRFMLDVDNRGGDLRRCNRKFEKV